MPCESTNDNTADVFISISLLVLALESFPKPSQLVVVEEDGDEYFSLNEPSFVFLFVLRPTMMLEIE